MFVKVDDDTIKEVIQTTDTTIERIYKISEIKSEIDDLKSKIEEKNKELENIQSLSLPEDYKNILINNLMSEISQLDTNLTLKTELLKRLEKV